MHTSTRTYNSSINYLTSQNSVQNLRINYIYGFNGMEGDDEIKDGGNSYDFGARMLDPRIGRFLSIDAYWAAYPKLSPYCYAANQVISFTDKNGDGPIIGWHMKSMHADKENKVYTIEYDITISRDIRLVNMSTLKLTPQEGIELAKSIADSWSNCDFTYQFDAGSQDAATFERTVRTQYTHIPKDYKVQFKVNINFTVGKVAYEARTDASGINTGETLIGIVDEIPPVGDAKDPAGLAESSSGGGEACIVEKKYISPKSIVTLTLNLMGYQVSVHEMLHLDAALDTYTKTNSGCGIMGWASQNFTLCEITKAQIAFQYLLWSLEGHSILMGESTGSGNVIPITKAKDYKTEATNNNGVAPTGTAQINTTPTTTNGQQLEVLK